MWTYYTWKANDGHLYDDNGNVDIFKNGKPIAFLTADDAEQYLIDNNICGTVL